MNKIVILSMVVLVTFVTACSNSVKSDINHYKDQMKNVQIEEKKLVNTIEHLNLDKVDQLIGSEVTEKKKDKLNAIELEIKQHVIVQLADYEKELKKVKVETDEVAEVHAIYLDNFKKKKTFINKMDKYITLYNDSIRSNEQILNYTKTFEKNKALSNKYAERAIEHDEIDDYNTLSKVINDNSQDLKKSVDYLMNGKSKEKIKYIDDTLIPLIKSHVDKLNQTNIKSENVHEMRKAQIEIDYSLINYYRERKNAMKTEEQLQHIPIQSILEQANEIKTIDDKYYQALKNLEEGA